MPNKPSIFFATNAKLKDSHPFTMALQRLSQDIEAYGYEVVYAQTAEDALALAQTKRDFVAYGICWDQPDSTPELRSHAQNLIEIIRSRNPHVPIFLAADKTDVQKLPLVVSGQSHEFIYVLSDTAAFIAKRIHLAARQYIKTLLPPYFGTLKNFTEDGDYYWDCPGHMGGAAYFKHPVGAEFIKFFGENMMRADIGVATSEMGDYLEHVGVPKASEDKAAALFGADWSFYCVGGSSTSNRIVTQAAIGAGEITIVDRNCHKSLNHGLTLAHAHPVYLKPYRNGYGMIGPIPPARMKKTFVQKLIKNSPLAQRAIDQNASYAVVTNCTYDGFCYDVKQVVEALGASAPRLHFDEAWYAYAKFHPLYAGRFAMDESVGTDDAPTIFAVQSTHKMLPSLSMASMIHIKKSPRAEIDYHDFNDAFMMHGTTSPYYPIIASMDVAVSMMSGESGPSLMQEAIEDAIAFRKAMVSIKRQLLEKEGKAGWFFDVFQPREVNSPTSKKRYSFEDAPVALLSQTAACWTLKAGDSWHGFADKDIEDANCMLDPVKVTITTPGITPSGQLEENGIPAYIVSKFLDSRRTEIARTGDYTLLILFSVGTTKGKWSSLIASLLEFKRLYDNGAKIAEAMPELVADEPAYADLTLKQLCDQMHKRVRDLAIPQRLEDAVSLDPEPVLTPAEAFQKVVRYKAEPVRISAFAGRIAASMLVPYPPGIPVLMPGERLPSGKNAIVDYLLALQEFGKSFPGFEHEVHGIHADENGDFWVRAIIEENRPPAKGPRTKKPVRSNAVKHGR